MTKLAEMGLKVGDIISILKEENPWCAGPCSNDWVCERVYKDASGLNYILHSPSVGHSQLIWTSPTVSSMDDGSFLEVVTRASLKGDYE